MGVRNFIESEGDRCSRKDELLKSLTSTPSTESGPPTPAVLGFSMDTTQVVENDEEDPHQAHGVRGKMVLLVGLHPYLECPTVTSSCGYFWQRN